LERRQSTAKTAANYNCNCDETMSSSPEESNNVDGECDETGTMQLPMHDQLPSLEEVHQKSSLELPSGTFEERKETSRQRTWAYCIAIAISCIVFACIIGIVWLKMGATNPEEEMGAGTRVESSDAATVRATASPTVPPTAKRSVPPAARAKTRMEQAVEYLGLLSDAALLENDETPQARALEWIVNGDLQPLEVPAVVDGTGSVAGPSDGDHRFVQRYVLAVLYYAMAEVLEYGDTDNWRREFNFMTVKNECEWHEELAYAEAEQVYFYGVACDWKGRVTSIYMPKNRLEGTIPPEIALLPSLRVLNLSENRLYGELPPQMSNLVNLEVVLLAMNDISGTIPDYLGTFSQLKKLSLLDNMFTGFLPNLQSLKKLTHLDLSNNMDLKGTIPESWGELEALRGLFLSFNDLEGTLPGRIGDMKNLRDLRLTSNYFEGTIPDSLRNCMHLKNLYLDDNELTGELDVLGNLVFLEGVFLAQNDFGGGLDMLVEKLDDLMILDANANILTGTLPRSLFTKDRLKVLDLNDNSLQGVLPDFPDNDSLEYLALQDNQFSTDVPASVSNLRALTHLDLSDNELTGSIPMSVGNMDLLTYLNLSWNLFGAAPIPDFLQRLTALRELSLRDTRRNGTIPYWIEVMQELVLLDLGNNDLEGTVEGRAFSEMKNLTFVQLSGNALVGEVPKVFATLPKLQVLTVEMNSFTGLENGFCETGGNLFKPEKSGKKSVFSGDCDISSELTCFSNCCTARKCIDITEKMSRGQDLQWDHTYGYWFSMNERIVYDIRPMIEAGELATKDSYAQYNILDFDYGVDDDDDGYADDDDDDGYADDDDDEYYSDDDDDEIDDDVYDDDDFFDDDADDMSVPIDDDIDDYCTRPAETKIVKMGTDGGGFQFVPAKTAICAGDSVKWIYNKGGPHNVVFVNAGAIPAGVSAEKISMSWDEKLSEEGDFFVMKFDTKGDYDYYCEPHRAAGMSGMLTVA